MTLGYTGVFTKCVEPIVKRENVASTTIRDTTIGEPGGVISTDTGSDRSRRRRATMARTANTVIVSIRHLTSLGQVIDELSMPEPNSGCWLWIANYSPNGYGRIFWRDKKWHAHRASWTARNGEIPLGAVVRHRCDNPACVNPDHLEIGTHADNMADKVARGRVARASAKLTEEDVHEIRASSLTAADLGRLFGVSYQAIIKVRTGQSWGHV